jgi:hypothetical protein
MRKDGYIFWCKLLSKIKPGSKIDSAGPEEGAVSQFRFIAHYRRWPLAVYDLSQKTPPTLEQNSKIEK